MLLELALQVFHAFISIESGSSISPRVNELASPKVRSGSVKLKLWGLSGSSTSEKVPRFRTSEKSFHCRAGSLDIFSLCVFHAHPLQVPLVLSSVGIEANTTKRVSSVVDDLWGWLEWHFSKELMIFLSGFEVLTRELQWSPKLTGWISPHNVNT